MDVARSCYYIVPMSVRPSEITVDCDALPRLHQFAYRGDLRGLRKYIVEHVDDNIDIDMRGPNGVTATMIASYFGQTHMLEPLIVEYGADPNAKDDHGLSPIHYAVQGPERPDTERQIEIVLERIEALMQLVNNMPPLHRAAGDGDVARVRQLLVNASVESKGPNGMTPLMVASLFGQKNMITCLVEEFGASTNSLDNDMVCVLAYGLAGDMYRSQLNSQVEVAI